MVAPSPWPQMGDSAQAASSRSTWYVLTYSSELKVGASPEQNETVARQDSAMIGVDAILGIARIVGNANTKPAMTNSGFTFRGPTLATLTLVARFANQATIGMISKAMMMA